MFYTEGVMNIRRILTFPVLSALLIAGFVVGLPALEIDEGELETVEGADIEFENYEGPVEQIDSREAIRGIGRTLGNDVARRGSGDYAGRYRVQRVVGDETDPRLAADIFELSDTARVDHIVNLRRIITGYLETAWAYDASDADLLARFVTIYNAVYRGSTELFTERYREAVADVLSPERVGLATSYRRWPGMTQIVIPLRGDRVPGDLDAVDPRQLIDTEVIAELRTRADLGIEDRKAIIDFIERVIEERTEVIAEERAEIEEEEAEIDERRREIAEETEEREDDAPDEDEVTEEAPPADDDDDDAEDEEPAEPDTPEAPPAEDEDTDEPEEPRDDDDVEDETPQEEQATDEPEEDTPEPEPADDDDEAEQEEEELDRREAELEERRAELDEEEEELEELTEEVEELYQDTAEDQTAVEEGLTPREVVPFVRSIGGEYELVAVDIASLSLAGEQTIPVVTRELVPYQGGVLVVHAGSERLLHLEPGALEILEESDVRVVPGAPIVVTEQRIFTVIPEDGGSRIGEFDAQLVLQRRSAATVDRETDIVVRDERLLVQGTNGAFIDLAIEDFR